MTTQVQNTTFKISEIMKRFILLFVLALVTLTSCENVQDNQTSIQADSYSMIMHEMYGKTKKILDEYKEIRGQTKV